MKLEEFSITSRILSPAAVISSKFLLCAMAESYRRIAGEVQQLNPDLIIASGGMTSSFAELGLLVPGLRYHPRSADGGKGFGKRTAPSSTRTVQS